MDFAFLDFPFFASQRGLSGTRNMPRKNSSGGAALSANIQRHPFWPYQEFWMNASVAPAGRLRTRYQLRYCAAKMPMTMVSWLMETSLPRICAGAISAIYIGERLDARPMATPPKMRHAMKMVKLLASALPREVTAKTSAATINNRLRPNLSLNAPAINAPTKQPISAQLLAQPI